MGLEAIRKKVRLPKKKGGVGLIFPGGIFKGGLVEKELDPQKPGLLGDYKPLEFPKLVGKTSLGSLRLIDVLERGAN